MSKAGVALAAQLEQLSTLGDRFPVTCAAEPPGTWVAASALVVPHDSAWPAVIDAYAASLGTPHRRIAASIALQSYGTRIAGLTLGAWTIFGVVPALPADELHVRFDGGRTAGLWLPAPRHATPGGVEGGSLDAVGAELFGHLRPVVEAVRRHATISSRRAWGNLAASCAGIFSALDRVVEPERAPALREQATAFFARADWPVAGLIDWQLWGTPPAQRLCHERRTCCLIRDVPGHEPCESCSLRPPQERRAAWEASLREPRPAPFAPTCPTPPTHLTEIS